ncbi:DciA family protein [Kitasatospora sp. NPDC015120]|uniref:DciA family protein n=1 Tax=Kitasatospora sp. NPDC015120 TaxID=3364023 RepID=UPI0036F45110
MTDQMLTIDQPAPDLEDQDGQAPQPSGADLARIALRAARRAARAAGNATIKGKQPTAGEISRQGRIAREPAGLAAIIPAMAGARGWELGTGRGTLRDRWKTIVGTENALHWAPAGFDPDTRTLRVVADSPAWATKLRLDTRRLLQQLDQHLPPGSVRAIDVRVGWPELDAPDLPRRPAAQEPSEPRPNLLPDSTSYQELRQQMRQQLQAREAAREEELARREQLLREHYGWLREPESAHRMAVDQQAAQEATAHDTHARRLRESHRAALTIARATRAGAIPLRTAPTMTPRNEASAALLDTA